MTDLKSSNKSLEKFRKNASEASHGQSSQKILQEILTLTQSLQLQKNPRILDIGCGTGSLIKTLKEKIIDGEFHGCDYTNFTKNTEFNFFQQDCNLDFAESIGQFDLIISSEVIEHLENARHFLREICKRLNPNSHVILSTPNIESFTSIISFILRGYHSAFAPVCYPAHINSYNAFELTNICCEAGLKIEQIFYIKNGRIPGSKIPWHTLLPFLSGKRFSDNFIIVASNHTFT